MKTNIFSLMPSATIFTTNPLFGMNSEETPETKGIPHQLTETNENEDDPFEDLEKAYTAFLKLKHENEGYLFEDPQKEYTVPLSKLKAFMQQNGRVLYMDEVATYKFSIGKRSFVLYHEYHSVSRKAPIPSLCPYSSVLFSHNTDGFCGYKTAFTGKHSVFEPLSDEIQNSHGKEHEICLEKHNFLESTHFVIVDAEEWGPSPY